MKLTFFLIAIGLITLRLCCPTLEIWHSGREQGTMITRSDNYVEGIWWSGKYRLSDDDRSIAEISPGGYLKFKENDTTLKAESDLEGKITYTLYNGSENLPLNDSGRNFMAAQLQKMIRLGFFGQERAERIYRQGGAPALLAELTRIKMTGDRDPYLDLLFRDDTLTTSQRIGLLQLIGNSGDDGERQHLLDLFSRDQLRDSAVATEWLSAVGRIGASWAKKDLLTNYIDSTLTAGRFYTVLGITTRFGSDDDQEDIYKKLDDLSSMRMYDSAFARPWLSAVGRLTASWMKKDLLMQFLDTTNSRAPQPLIRLPADQFDTVLAVATRLESADDQKTIYEQLIGMPPSTDAEWLGLIQATDALPDYLKSELLLKIASKMPRTDSLLSAYRSAAKRIQDDTDYGKVMRAVE